MYELVEMYFWTLFILWCPINKQLLHQN